MKIAHTGCWHFGHPRTPTKHICENIDRYLIPKLQGISVLFIAGDIFNEVCNLNSEVAIEVNQLFMKLANFCKTNNITIYMLKGTHSHDRDQIPFAVTVMNSVGFTDVKYVKTLSVIYDEKLDKWIGFLPDNTYHRDTDTLIKDIKHLLDANGIEKLDYLITHNTYDILNLPGQKGLVIEYDKIEKLVNQRILSGHIHTPSAYKKLIYAGSFDRLAHNEEHNKGFWLIDDETNKAEFIVNKRAFNYITIDVTKKASDDISAIDYIYQQGSLMEKCDEGLDIHLRVLLTNQDFIVMRPSILTFFRENYPNVKVAFADKSTANHEEYSSLHFKESTEKLEIINEETLPSIVFDRLIKKNRTDITLDEIRHILQK